MLSLLELLLVGAAGAVCIDSLREELVLLEVVVLEVIFAVDVVVATMVEDVTVEVALSERICMRQ